jgi:hypothetical protein
MEHLRRAPFDARARWHHRLDQADILGAQILVAKFGIAGQFQAFFRRQLVEHRRVGADQQAVAGAQNLPAQRVQHAGVAADQADHDGAVVVAVFQFGDRHADQVGLLGDTGFGDIVAHLEQIGGRFASAAAARDKPPADGDHEDQPDDGDRRPHRGEIEEPEGLAGHVGAEGGDDNIGWRADQGDQPAEDRPEGERHEQRRRFGVEPQRQRHEQGQRADIIHEGRHDGAETRYRTHLGGLAARGADQKAGHLVEDARRLQRLADHQHRGDGDNRRVAEPDKGVGRWHHPADHRGDQRGERHHVIAPTAPQEEHHGEAENGEDENLVGGHPSRRSSASCFETALTRLLSMRLILFATTLLPHSEEGRRPVSKEGVIY